MYTTTLLSNDKVSLLVQGLLDLKKRTQEELPPQLKKLVDELPRTNKHFLKGIDEFMHRHKWKVEEEEAVTTILNIYPEVLHTADGYGYLPIHTAATFCTDEAAILYLPLLAKVGHQNGVGGSDGRGGLLVEKNYGGNALQIFVLNCDDSPEVMKVLMEMDPPFFEKEDVSKYDLLGQVMYCEDEFRFDARLECLKYYIDLDTSSLFKKIVDSIVGDYLYPLCLAVTPEMAQYLLQRALKYYPQHSSIGTLFSTIVWFGRKMTVFDHLEERCNDDEYPLFDTNVWDIIEPVLSPYKEIPILHRVIEHAPQHISTVINRFPHSVFLRDESNRLPIHVALQNGLEWSAGLVTIINANISHLIEKDPVTGYYPFALAAEEPKCDLRTINHLLRMHPGQIESGIDYDDNKSAAADK